MILIVVLYAFLGLSFTLGKMTLFFASPFYVVGLRMVIGGVLLSVFLSLFKSTQYEFQIKDWPYFAHVTLFGIVIPYCLRAWGLQYVSSTKAAFIFTLMPFFTALFSYLFHHEKLSYQKSMGLLLGFVGMMPTLFTTGVSEEQVGSVVFFSWPELALLGAAASFGYNYIALKTLITKRQCPALVANMVTMLLGGVIALSLAFMVEPIWLRKDPITFFALLALQIVISNLLCAHLQASLLKTYSPTLMAFASLLVPLCASVFGWVLLHEVIHVQYMISLALILAGLALFYLDEITTL